MPSPEVDVDNVDTMFYVKSNEVPYQIDVTDGTVIYERWFSGDGYGTIRKTTIVGTVTTRYFSKHAKWANRTTTLYQDLYGAQ